MHFQWNLLLAFGKRSTNSPRNKFKLRRLLRSIVEWRFYLGWGQLVFPRFTRALAQVNMLHSRAATCRDSTTIYAYGG